MGAMSRANTARQDAAAVFRQADDRHRITRAWRWATAKPPGPPGKPWPLAFAARRSCRLGTGIVVTACAPRRVFVSHDVSCDSKRKPYATLVLPR